MSDCPAVRPPEESALVDAAALFSWAVICLGACIGCNGRETEAIVTPDLGLPSEAVTRLTGELHLHQSALGAHAWSAFIDQAVPVGDITTDQLVALSTVPTDSDGACTLYAEPVCAPDCAGDSYCSDTDVCTAFTAVTYVDGGEVDVTGSDLVPTIRMWFTSASSTYDADPTPGPDLLFKGGEVLHVQGGAGKYALSGILLAPKLVVVSAPDLTKDLHFPASGPLDVAWAAEGAAQMVLTLTASASDGTYATIRCVTADVGSLTVSARLLAGLPPPPRFVRFELERDDERILKTATPGVGILAHASFSSWENGME